MSTLRWGFDSLLEQATFCFFGVAMQDIYTVQQPRLHLLLISHRCKVSINGSDVSVVVAKLVKLINATKEPRQGRIGGYLAGSSSR